MFESYSQNQNHNRDFGTHLGLVQPCAVHRSPVDQDTSFSSSRPCSYPLTIEVSKSIFLSSRYLSSSGRSDKISFDHIQD